MVAHLFNLLKSIKIVLKVLLISPDIDNASFLIFSWCSNKYFPATILECDNHNLPTAENELFGPVLSVMKFETEDEVINKMNDNQYGLSSGIYTKDLGRGLRVSKAIRAGITFVNTYRLISPSAPFGGMKDSGYGKEAGIESIKDYTRIKTTWFNTSEKPMSDPFTMG